MNDFDVMEGMAARQVQPGPIGHNPDDNLLVKFYLDTVQDDAASQEQGRPIFKEVEMIDIRVPGSRNNVVRIARESDKERFPRHYAAFKNRTSMEGIEGTPLAEWPVITRSRVEELAFLNIKTVEQLANMPDSNAQQVMGFYGLKQKANEWLEKANGIEALQAKLAERDRQMEALMARLEALENKPAPRKKKVTRKQATSKKE